MSRRSQISSMGGGMESARERQEICRKLMKGCIMCSRPGPKVSAQDQ